jgi:SWI/SNF-related matrix-associated actin-dependent regulator of chromatin subfamily A member 5
VEAADQKAVSGEKKEDCQKDDIDLEETLSKLLTDEQKAEKARLLAEGFSDWSRIHYTSFVKASAKYGRMNYVKIANDVGKPVSAIQTYSEAFFDEDFGKKRFSEHEYDRIVKIIEKGEKKIEDTKGLQRGTRVLISLFENPWVELQFTHYNMKDINKDKKFTPQEDRFLLCWAHKVSNFVCVPFYFVSFC